MDDLVRLARSLRAAAAAGRDAVAVYGFTLYLARARANPHLSLAVPDDDPAALDWLPQLQRGLREGTSLGGAVDLDGGPVAGAVVMLGGDAGELAGVWTHPRHRHRGLARQASHALLATAFGSGVPLAWLSAAEGALRLYLGLGFERVGTQVNLEAP